MAAIANARDKILQAAPSRTTNLPTAAILLTPTALGFHVNTGGSAFPAAITFNADLNDLEGAIVFSATGATLTSMTAKSAVVTYANMPGATALVTATVVSNGVTFEKSFPLTKVLDGAPGTPGIVGLNNATINAYQRATSAPSGNPGAVDYDFTTKLITTASLANGWLKTIPAGSSPLYVTSATASSSSSTDSIAGSEWSTPVIIAQDGGAGLSNASITIYQRTNSATAPALPSAATTYTFATGVLSGLNNGWSQTYPTATLAGAFVHVSTATAASTAATDSIPAAEWAVAKVLARDGLVLNNIVPDPTFRDTAWWGRAGYSVADYSDGSTFWKMGYPMQFPANGFVIVSTVTGWFPILPNAKYRCEIQVFLSADFNGNFGLYIEQPTVNGSAIFAGMPITGGGWSDIPALQTNFNGSSAKGAFTYSAVMQMPNVNACQRTRFLIRSQVASGYIEIGSISIVRMSDTDLIPPGVTINNPTLNNPNFGVFTVAITGGLTSVVANGYATYGTRLSTITGGTGPFQYQWTVSGVQYDGGAANYFCSTDPTASSISVRGAATNMWISGTQTLTVTDLATGLTAIASVGHIAKHGTYTP